jgi:hypothetical protein
MLRNRVEEALNNPGSALSVQLGGAASPGLRTFLQAFGASADAFYFIEAGPLWECGIGNVTAGPPVTFNRNTVLDNSAGNNSRMNFTGAARIYNFVPASHIVYKAQFDASVEQQTGVLGQLQTSLTNEQNARIAADTANNQFITAEGVTRAREDTALRTLINSVDATRAAQEAQIRSSLNDVNNARASQDNYFRQLQIDDDNYYRNVQVQDDQNVMAILRAEATQNPVNRVIPISGAWVSNGARFDPVWETYFFNLTLPIVTGAPVVRIYAQTTCTVRHAGPDIGDQAMVLRARLFGPGGYLLNSGVQAWTVWVANGTYGTISGQCLFGQVGIPPGSYLAFSAERSWKEGGPSAVIVEYYAQGFCVLG